MLTNRSQDVAMKFLNTEEIDTFVITNNGVLSNSETIIPYIRWSAWKIWTSYVISPYDTLSSFTKIACPSFLSFHYYAPERTEGAISIAFVSPSVRLSVCPSVAYIANNSRTQRPSVPKFGRKVPHLDATHTSFKVKRSKVSVGGSRGHTVSAEPGGHTACFILHCITCLSLVAYDILTSRPVRELHVTYGNLPVNLGIPRLRFWVRCSMYQILQTSVQCQNADY